MLLRSTAADLIVRKENRAIWHAKKQDFIMSLNREKVTENQYRRNVWQHFQYRFNWEVRNILLIAIFLSENDCEFKRKTILKTVLA